MMKSVLIIIWLAIGVFVANDRGYFKADGPDCSRALTIAATVVVGPLNYVPGINPRVNCNE